MSLMIFSRESTKNDAIEFGICRENRLVSKLSPQINLKKEKEKDFF